MENRASFIIYFNLMASPVLLLKLLSIIIVGDSVELNSVLYWHSLTKSLVDLFVCPLQC